MASRSPRCITNGATTPRRFIDASKRSPRRVPLGETPSRTPPASGEAFSREPLLVRDQHEQSQEHNGGCDTCYPILLPASAWKEKWDLVVMLLIVYSAVTVPVRVCFASDAEGWLWYFEVAMSFAFLFDLSLNFRMAYHRDGERGELVTDRREIAVRYLSGWFWIDAPSSLPVEVIELLLPDDVDTSNLALLRALRVFRLVRLLKLLKLDALLGRLEELLDVNLRIVKLVFLVVKMFFVAHLLACGWFYVATHSPGGESWLTTYDDGSAVDGPLSRQYLFSLYWAFTTLTTVGYGDITPTNDSERQFATVALLAGAFVFAYILGDISSLLATLDRQAALVEEKMDAVKEYLAWRGIPRELSMRVRRYYECVPQPMPGLCPAYAPPSSGVPSLVATFPLLVPTLPPGIPWCPASSTRGASLPPRRYFYTQHAVFDEETILRGLSTTLHGEVVQCILHETTKSIPLFGRVKPEFLNELFPHLKPMSLERDESVFRRGGMSATLYFLAKGEVIMLGGPFADVPLTLLRPREEVALGSDGTPMSAPKFSSSCFGQEVLLGRRRETTVSAHTRCELLVIDKESLIDVFKHDVVSTRRICAVVVRGFRERDLRRRFVMAHRIRVAANNERRLCAALKVQLAWMIYTDREAQKHDILYQHVLQDPQRRIRKRGNVWLGGESGLDRRSSVVSHAVSHAVSTPLLAEPARTPESAEQRAGGTPLIRMAAVTPAEAAPPVTGIVGVDVEAMPTGYTLRTELDEMRQVLANVSKVQGDLHTSQLHLTAQVAGMDAKLSAFIASVEERARSAPPTPYLVI